MDNFLVKGFGGKKLLEGVLPVRGAKNCALKAQAASLLFKDEMLLRNAPLIEDVRQMNFLLENLGIKVEKTGVRSFRFKIPRFVKTDINQETAKVFRSSVVLTGPLLARGGRVSFPYPGGCVIGQRPIDIFLDAFKKMGAKIKTADSSYTIEADKLRPADIFFRLPSVTGTETLIMTAVLVKGRTLLRNCACEPEIVALADFLNASGADIRGAGTHTVAVYGGKLLSKGVFNVPADRIEAGTFAALASLCGKNIKISNCEPEHLGAVLQALTEMGVRPEIGRDYILIKAPRALRPISLKTREYPGFPTDMQAPFSVILTQANGRSYVFETIFEDRLNYLSDLRRMGADIVICDPHRVIINGATRLRGREMETPDLRAGLAFLMAAMVARGSSTVHNIYNIDRGYEKVEERLNVLGADIKRIGN